MKKSLLVLMLLSSILSFSIVAYAGTNGWSYSNYSYGSYVPKIGNFTEWTIASSDGGYYYWSKTSFKLDSYNISKILDYNNGGENPGPSCDNSKAYLTLDMTAISASWDLEIGATAVYSNFPSPKYDLEDNSFFGEKDESEVVALGSVIKDKEYYMKTKWSDYRDGDTGDKGNIQAQFAMSKKGVWDYNNCTQSSTVQVINPYGIKLGSL